MIFTGKQKQTVTLLRKYIESLGGSLIKECSGGSVYYSLDHIECIRISDHIGLKAGAFQFDIILKGQQFLCIYNRDFKLFDKIADVKQFISDMQFTINIFHMHIENSYDNEMSNLRKALNRKQNDIEHLTKVNKDLNHQINENIQTIAKRDRQLEDKNNKLRRASEYHNKCQELESQMRKMQVQLNKLWIIEAHANE